MSARPSGMKSAAPPTARDPDRAAFTAGLLAFLSASVLTVLAGLVFAASYGPVTPTPPEELARIFAADPEDFRPEPVERTLYLGALLLFPVALYLFRAFYIRKLRGVPAGVAAPAPSPAPPSARMAKTASSARGRGEAQGASPALFCAAYGLTALCVAVVLLGGFWHECSDVNSVQLLQQSFYVTRPAAVVLLFILGGLIWACAWAGLIHAADETFLASRPRWRRWCPRVFEVLAWLPLSAFFLMTSFEVYPYFGASTNDALTGHFNAVFHAMVQVQQGQALLIDLTHQYGLYPHFIEPLFRWVGLSAGSFAILMAALNAASFYLLYRLTREAGRNAAVAWGGVVLQVMLLYVPRYIVNEDKWPQMEAYYQFHPVRILFPCLSMYLCWRYFSAPKRWLYWTCWALFSAGALWNLDSGLVVVLAWLLVLAYDELCAHPWRAALPKMFAHAAKGGLVLAGVVALFSLYMRLRYGAWPDYLRTAEYQRLFYLYGFYMLPLPLLGAWCAAALAYAFGLLHACRAAQERQRSARHNLIFFISVLGCGLFSYYQGRSHIHCLLAVLYPAVVLSVLFADEVFSAWRRKAPVRLGAAALTALVLFLLSVATWEWVVRGTAMFRPGVTNLVAILRGKLSSDTIHAAYLREHFQPGERALISSWFSGLYHLESRTVSPVKAPGTLELVLQRDWDRLREWLAQPHPGERLLLDSCYLTAWRHPNSGRLNRDGTLGRYRIVDVSLALGDDGPPHNRVRDLLVLDGPDEWTPGRGPAWLTCALDETPGTLRHYRVDSATGAVYSREAGLEGRWNAPPVALPAEFTIELVVFPPAAAAAAPTLVWGSVAQAGMPFGFQVTRSGDKWTFLYGREREHLETVNFSLPPQAWGYFAASVARDRIRVCVNDGCGEKALSAFPTSGTQILIGPGVEEARLVGRARTTEELKAQSQRLAAKGAQQLRVHVPK